MAPYPTPPSPDLLSPRGSISAGGLGLPQELKPLSLDTHSLPVFFLPSVSRAPPTQLALWLGSCLTSSSHPQGKDGGQCKAHTGLGPLEYLGPTGQHWSLGRRLCPGLLPVTHWTLPAEKLGGLGDKEAQPLQWSSALASFCSAPDTLDLGVIPALILGRTPSFPPSVLQLERLKASMFL